MERNKRRKNEKINVALFVDVMRHGKKKGTGRRMGVEMVSGMGDGDIQKQCYARLAFSRKRQRCHERPLGSNIKQDGKKKKKI